MARRKKKKMKMMYALPVKYLKTRIIVFDDRLQQVRVQHINRRGHILLGRIEFHDYDSDKGFNIRKRHHQL